jgi:thiosulfate/3-mercaptopyruvate sulfurtransferase
VLNSARYTGDAPEPRPSLSSGHIPNSLPLPFSAYLDPSSPQKPYTSLKTPDQLQQVLVQGVGGSEAWSAAERGERGLIFTCGSGMTAAVGWLANEIVKQEGGGASRTAIYDEVS